MTKLCVKLGATMLAAALLTMMGAAAQAEPIATVTIKNNWAKTAVYNTQLSQCSTNKIEPNLADIAAGQPGRQYTMASKTSNFTCLLYYSGGGNTCRFVVSRLVSQSCNPLTGACRYTWDYPRVYATTYGSTTCNYNFTAVNDTNAEVTPTNGRFSVTLTLQ